MRPTLSIRNKFAALGLSLVLLLSSSPSAEALRPRPLQDVTSYLLGDATGQNDLSRCDLLEGTWPPDILIEAMVRDYLKGRPYSQRSANLMEEAWALPNVCKYIDDYGVFDLAPLAQRKAVALSKEHVAILDDDGVLSLIDTAQYYLKTGRKETAKQIYENLTAHLWPDCAPKDSSGTILFAYSKFLEESGDIEANSTVMDRFVSMNLDPKKPYSLLKFYADHKWLTVDAGWKPAYDAYLAISQNNLADARAKTNELLAEDREEEESNRPTHSPARIVRLLHLACLYEKYDKSEAQHILQSILPYCNNAALLNTKLQILAELFLLRGRKDKEGLKYWEQLGETAEKIGTKSEDLPYANQDLPDLPTELRVAELDRLALAYAFNDEPEKAARFLDYALANSPNMGWHRDQITAHQVLFAAQAGDYNSLPTRMQKVLNNAHYVDTGAMAVIARIIDICSQAEKFDVGEALAKQTIDACTQMAEHPASDAPQYDKSQTAEQLAEQKSWDRRAQLALVRLKYGQLLIRQKRLDEAEANLKLIEPTMVMIPVDSGQAQLALARCQTLEGLQKYREALDVYATGYDYNYNALEFFNQLNHLIASKPQFTEEEQTKIIEVVSKIHDRVQQKTIADCMNILLALGQSKKWSESNIQTIQDWATYCNKELGTTDEQKEEQIEIEAKQAALAKVKNDLSAANLEYLSSWRCSVDQTRQYLCYSDLFRTGGLDTLESILKLCVKTINSSPDVKRKNLTLPKCLLLEFYMTRKRFDEAKDISGEILTTLYKDPAAFINASSITEISGNDTNSAPVKDVPEIHFLNDAAAGLLVAGKTSDAAALAERTLEVQKKWLGPKNPELCQTYAMLGMAAKSGDPEAEKKYKMMRETIEEWNKTTGSKRELDKLCKAILTGWQDKKYEETEKLISRKMALIESIEGQIGCGRSMCLAEMACVEISKKNNRRARELLALAQKASSSLGQTAPRDLQLAFAAVMYKLGEQKAAVDQAANALKTMQYGRHFLPFSPFYLIAYKLVGNSENFKSATSPGPMCGNALMGRPGPGLFALDPP